VFLNHPACARAPKERDALSAQTQACAEERSDGAGTIDEEPG